MPFVLDVANLSSVMPQANLLGKRRGRRIGIEGAGFVLRNIDLGSDEEAAGEATATIHGSQRRGCRICGHSNHPHK
jgi:hypothetical protein